MINFAAAAPDPDVPPYLRCAVELPGAVAEWDLGDLPGSPPRLTILAVDECDWLSRLVGEAGHRAVVAAAAGDAADLPVPIRGSAELHRLAYGHWLRRWWPASSHGPIPVLDPVLLDLEVALLTLAAERWFSADTLDSDPAALLARWTAAEVCARASDPTPGARDLFVALGRHPDELVPHWTSADLTSLAAALTSLPPVRTDFALAAGAAPPPERAGRIASGVASIDWPRVPPHLFDAAEDGVAWSVEATSEVIVEVGCTLLPGADAAGIAVRLDLPPQVALAGLLDSAGQARLVVPVPARVAWTLPWERLRCTVGVGTPDPPEPSEDRAARETVRRFARGRLSRPADPSLFVAERAAALLDY